MLRVLVADDSALAREALSSLIDDDPEMMVVGVAGGGAETVAKAELLKPDLITLDLLMPDMDGVEATRRIMASAPTPIVLVSSTVSAVLGAQHFDALAVGAVDVVEKPDFGAIRREPSAGDRFLRNLKAMSAVVTVTRRKGAETPAARTPPPGRSASDRPSVPRRAGLIALGASTGGPAAVARALSGLDTTSPPVVVVQHMANGFTQSFVEWLGHKTAARVELACNGARLMPGTVYVAPDRRHVEITPHERLVVFEGPPVRHQLPSVDVLFESVALHAGRRALGVLLTGMGDDGARGLLDLRRNGAFTIAQNRETCAVYGMPAAAAERGAAAWIAALDEIARALGTVRHESRAASGGP